MTPRNPKIPGSRARPRRTTAPQRTTARVTLSPVAAASLNAVANAAQTWSTEVLKCRLMGHSWDQYRAEHMTRYHYWHIRFRCERSCGVEKWEEWTEQGLVTAKGMNYPRDENGKPLYLLEGFGRVDSDGRGVLRLESVTRTKFIEISGNDPDNAPTSASTIKRLKENKLWPSN